MTKTKYDDTWFLEQEQKIFAVIGWPAVGGKEYQRVYYCSNRKLWFFRAKYTLDGVWHGAEQLITQWLVAKIIRDYLREQLEEKDDIIFKNAHGDCQVERWGLRDDGESGMFPIGIYKSYNEALIKTGRIVFMGGV